MEEVDCDAVYEDIIECMGYETNVKSFFYPDNWYNSSVIV